MSVKNFKDFIGESTVDHNKRAKKMFDYLHGASQTVGANRGNVRVYYNHSRTGEKMVGEKDHFSYNPEIKNGHHFAKYVKDGSKETYMHVHLPKNADLKDHEYLTSEVKKQNPHIADKGFTASNWAHSIKILN